MIRGPHIPRRKFLAAAGGAILWPPYTRPQTPSAACPPACPASGWSTSLPTQCCPGNYDACDPVTDPPNPIQVMPPAGLPTIDFHPPGGPAIERRLWSQIQPDTNPADRQLVMDLRDAYHAIAARPKEDPTSLLYQTWLHDFYCGKWDQGDVHSTWAFLPWHRAFTYFHEKILASALPGKRDFRLPVWDWEKNCEIPKFFVELGLPCFLQGSAGRLPTPDKNQVGDCVQQAWLLSEDFQGFAGYPVGGGKPGRASGGPHATVHKILVGGAMRIPPTAAADPVFYGHHANVDRFWTYWAQRYKFAPPADWRKQSFFFHDEQRRLVRVTAAQLVNERLLGYKYTPPSVQLCNYETLDFLTLATEGAMAVIRTLEELLFGGFLAGARRGIVEMRQFITALRAGTFDLAEILKGACLTAFPVRIVATLDPDAISSGSYYLVQLQRGTGAAYNLAGFGVFGAAHQHGPSQVAIGGCLDSGVLQAFFTGSGDFKLCYGKSPDGIKITGETQPLNTSLVSILYPKGYLAAGAKILGSLLL